jgi:hypothetical protein
MYVQYFGAFVIQPLTEPRDITQGAQSFFSDGPVQVLSTAVADTLTQGAVGGDYGYPVPLCNSKLAQFGGNQLRPAQIERHQRLNNVHDSKP